MGIINRTQDISEQKDLIAGSFLNVGTGATVLIHKAPRAQVITDAKCSTVGISGAPTLQLALERFVVGAGLTHISIGGALTAANLSTSGSQTFSLPATGSSLLNLAAGDVLCMVSGAANAAAVQYMVDVVVQNVQDIKTWY
jgi:hypothetical protein